MRHLTEPQATGVLERGAGLEQMLSRDLRAGSFRWLSAAHEGGTYVLRLHETRDDGSPDFLDVYEFRSVDADDELGEGVIAGSTAEATELLAAAGRSGARLDRWVNAGVIQDEYAELISTR